MSLYSVVADKEQFLLVDKAPGVAVHRDSAKESLLETIKQDMGYRYLAPVHRLDKETSGLWLLAKNRDAAAQLSLQFAERRVEKFYIALSDRKPRKKQGMVEGALIKVRKGSYKLAREGEPWSITQFFSYGVGGGLRLFLLKPFTGRTHQLRVVMKSLGSPILGDRRYGGTMEPGEGQVVDRCYLHSYAISFEIGGVKQYYVCPPQSGTFFADSLLQQKLQVLQKPWEERWPIVKSSTAKLSGQ